MAFRSGRTPRRASRPLIDVGDSVEAWRRAESSQARESRGDWTRAHAEPIAAKGAKVGAPTGSNEKKSLERDAEIKQSDRQAAGDVLSGPAGTDEPDPARVEAGKKAARTRARNERRESRQTS
jgi:hypothetical protein